MLSAILDATSMCVMRMRVSAEERTGRQHSRARRGQREAATAVRYR
jgi:hypothetical protein